MNEVIEVKNDMKPKIQIGINYQTQKFVKTFKAIEKILNRTEIELEINESSIDLIELDISHIAIVKMKIEASSFYEYYVEKPQRIRVNFKDFLNAINKTTKKSMIELKIYEKFLEVIVINSFSKTTKMKLLDLSDKDELRIPNLDIYNQIKLISNVLKEFIKENKDNKYVDISVTSEKLKLSSIDKNNNNSITEIERNNENMIDFKINENAESQYSIPLLNDFCGLLLDSTDFVTMKIGNDKPLQIEYENGIGYKIDYFLAPKIKEE